MGNGVLRNSRKTFSKALSMILALAMVLTLIPSNLSMMAKAEEVQSTDAVVPAEGGTESGVKLYFKLPADTTASDWAVNAWDAKDVTVTGDTEHAFRPTTWGEGDKYPTLLTEGAPDGWGYVTLTGKVAGMAFIKEDANGVTELKCWNAEIANKELSEAYYDPAGEKWYEGADLTTEIKAAEIQNIFVVAGDGGLTGNAWAPTAKGNEGNVLKQVGTTNKYSITYNNVAAGTYKYKILQDPDNKGWDLSCGGSGDQTLKVDAPADVTLTIDASDISKAIDVQIAYIKTITVSNNDIVKGKETALNTSGLYYDGVNTKPTEVAVTYALKTATEGVTVTAGNIITVAENSELTEVTLAVSYEDFSVDVTIPVVAKLYSVTINMYAEDFDVTKSDIYIFEKDGNTNTVVTLDKTVADNDNNVTWASGTVTLPYTSLGIIGRPTAGSWTGQDGNQYYVIDKDKEEITLWYVFGDSVSDEKPNLSAIEKRYFYLEYENADLDEEIIPQFYSWTIGGAKNSTLIPFKKQDDGIWKAIVQVSTSCTKVDFVVALDTSGDPWIKDGGDHSITFPLDQRVVCAKMNVGEEPTLAAPYNVGYELKPAEDKIAFYYRDDDALVNGNLKELGAKVEINDKDYEMTYNDENKRFEYAMELQNGRTFYRYHVGTDYILDKYNADTVTKGDTEYSYADYYALEATVSANALHESFNYNENNVVGFEIVQEKKDGDPDLEVKEASIDVSALGGSSALAIDPALQAVTISATTDTPVGKKTLPITVTDQFGNVYTTSVDVTVTERVKTKEPDDFDWDEAVVYFMVTDRFFDGNEGNNTASDALLDKYPSKTGTIKTTYGTDDPGLYHGGDFAGVTAKLDYLQDLGINTIWITPIVENIPGVDIDGNKEVPYNAAYHGYWASDFEKLNPTLGTEDEFKALIDEAHKRGIKIMVDIVINHAGYGTEKDKFVDMIRSQEETISGDDQKDALSNLPDFATEKEEVREKLVAWQTQWVKNFDIDYYRVDTVKHVEGTTWAALKNSLTEVNPAFKMIGEYSGAGYASNGGSLGTGQMDSDLDFDFNDQATNFVTGSITSVENFLTARNAKLNNTYMTGQFLGSHDEIGFKQNLMSSKKMTAEAATAASLVAATLQITAKGQPVIYYGEEIGLTGENIYPYQTNRYDFDWTKTTNDNVTYQHYKKLLAIRKQYTDVFARGTRKVLAKSDDEGYDVVERAYGEDSLIVGMNIKDKAQNVTISVDASLANVKDLYSGKTFAVSNGNVTVTIPASSKGGTVILVAGDKKSTDTPKDEDDKPSQPEQPKPEDPKPEQPSQPEQPTQPEQPSQPQTETPQPAKVDTVLKSSTASYKVTSADASEPTVVYTGAKNKKATKVTIPATIKADGVSYKVTSIAKNAFKNNKKIKSVTIGKNVTTIGTSAFQGCTALKKVTIPEGVKTISAKAFYGAKNLKTITIKSTVLKKVGSNAFKGIHAKATINVPKKKYTAYKKLLKGKGQAKTVKIKK